MIRSVAVIGAGSMGAAVARHVQDAGLQLTVCDLDDTVLASFDVRAARTTRLPADCAGADLVLVLVATPQQVLATLLGNGGLKSGLKSDLSPGHAPLVAVMSTVPMDTIAALHAELAPLVGGLVDAPISGGPSRADAGTLTVMAGGEAGVLDAIEPVLRSFASTIVRCGALGSGQATKIINNVVGIATAVVAAEAYRLAADLGLDIAATARALELGTGRSFYSADAEGPRATYAAMVAERRGFDSLLAIIRKDIGFANELTRATPGRYPAIAGLQSLLAGLGDETYENWRFVGGLPPRDAQRSE